MLEFPQGSRICATLNAKCFKANRKEPWEYDRTPHKRRNEVERLFRRLKGFRRAFLRFEKLDIMFRAFLRFVPNSDMILFSWVGAASGINGSNICRPR